MRATARPATSLLAVAIAVAAAVAVAAVTVPAAARAQDASASSTTARSPSRDTLRLGELHVEAERVDRRAAQLELLTAQSRLRLENLRTERLPAVSLLGQAQYLSDVPSLGGAFPGGGPLPPHDTYDAHVAVRQRLFDPSVAPRRAVERAQLAESAARLKAALYAQRQAVNEAFFGALLLDAQRAAVDAAIEALASQRGLASRRVTEGVALPSETARLDAELLRHRQSRAALVADRDAAREVLGHLVGRAIPPDATLALPAGDALAAAADSGTPALATSGRPEHAQFDRARAVIAERREAVRAQDLPRVAAFARAGHGRPGLNPLAREFDSYWLAGVQVEWTPWNWGGTRREQEVLVLQSEIVASEEAAFSAGLERAALRAVATVRQLAQALEADEAIVALRQRIVGETQLRYTEGVVTSAELVDRQTDLLNAELARVTHRVQLAEAHARLLTTLGREVR